MYSDDFSRISILNIDYDYNTQNLENLCGSPIDFSEIDKALPDLNAGMNSLDFVILNNYIKSSNIKTITELGCGSTSRFLNLKDINRTTFALIEVGGDDTIDYIKCDIFEKANEILESAKESDLILIDSLHNDTMAKFYFNNVLKQTMKPVFIHDFFDRGKQCYSEQSFWEENIINKFYNLYISANAYPVQRDNELYAQCSAILLPILK
jgi:hypothetical protein